MNARWIWLGLVSALGCAPASEPCSSPGAKLPDEFGAPVYNQRHNPTTPAGFELGRKLFYDGLLSRDGSVSCGSCHQQAFGFTDQRRNLSLGIEARKGTRNAQPLQNLAWTQEFFWDGGVPGLDLAPIAPLENHDEMDEKLGNVLAKLRRSPSYPPLFKAAYGSEEITTARFLQSLSQFMIALISANSHYDQYRKGTEKFTADEEAGLKLFSEKGCRTCHSGPLFSDGSFRNNGLPRGTADDSGRMRITERAEDAARFRVPSLRNVEVTRPYFHDGRAADLETVLDHYRFGVRHSATLDPLLNRDGRTGIPISEAEKRQLIAFLKTLTDREYLTNKRFGPPEK